MLLLFKLLILLILLAVAAITVVVVVHTFLFKRFTESVVRVLKYIFNLSLS
jgi:hypothetical protein